MQDHENGGRSDQSHALLIEADEAYRAVIAAAPQLAGCRVDQVATADLALPALDRRSYDLVVWGASSDDSWSRSEVISELRLRTEVPLVLVDRDSAVAQFELESGADQWLPKPFVPGALIGRGPGRPAQGGGPGRGPGRWTSSTRRCRRSVRPSTRRPPPAPGRAASGAVRTATTW